jgi:hypothetical protein
VSSEFRTLENRSIDLLSNKEEANMLKSKSLFALALLVPLLGAAIPAQAAKDSSAARAECFRKANEAVAAQGFSANTADKNAMGQDAYRQCCFKAGIRP